ncbi:SpoIIE family protein phosphatase [Pseudonocardia kujensis]|uniref:GAF domain-containing SpoIIE family protein phosphatase n=1 Tax=Pseudonocardia kujensis TaxID=1128675 RepID=UPI001E48FFFC|nr:SpoIIE family protein phosphatase [Pseudonocardia kujensis]MCE0766222.1 SpoIIE family protein phosphatase [Pseudonocardia kujensis]
MNTTRAHGTALQRLAVALLGAVTPEAIGRVAVTVSVQLLAADAGVLFDRTDACTLTSLFSIGWPAEIEAQYRHLALHRGRPLSDAVLDGSAVWLEGADQWRARYPEMAPIGTAGDREATACLPLRVDDRDLGAIVFSFDHPHAFGPDERAYLEAVAALCAQALDRARLLVVERRARADAERERDRMEVLARTAGLMEEPLSVEERLQRLADLMVPALADWCAVHLVRGDEVEQIAVAHDDPARLDFVLRLQERYPPDPSARTGAFEVSRSGTPSFLPDIPDELLVAGAVDEEHLQLIRSIGMRSAVLVPLVVRGHSLGALTLVHAESGRRFDELDLAFVQRVAGTAAVALDNARLYQQQRRIAHTLQAALLPTGLPDAPGLRLAARYRPQTDERTGVEVGGDVYDVVAAPDGRWAAVVADVCGKGPDAAALTALIRHTLRAEVAHGLGPVDALRRLNDAMLREARADGRFATVAHARIAVEADGGATVTLVGAGHPPALVRRADTVELVPTPGTLLGVFPDPVLRETTLRLDPGDILVLYTDGVTEARGVDGFYGVERMTAAAGAPGPWTAAALADALLTDVVTFQQGVLRDDIALLVVEVAP